MPPGSFVGMSTFSQINDFLRRSPTVKLLGIGFLALLLLIPATLVEELINDRQRLRERAVDEIGAQWGAAQRLAGPVIQVPYRYRETLGEGDEAKTYTRTGTAYFLSTEVDISAEIEPEERQRGIYVAVLYTARVRVTGRFDSLVYDRFGVEPEAFDFSRASLSFGVEDLRGIDSLTDLTLGTQTVGFQPGLPSPSLLNTGFQAPIDIDGTWRGGEFSFSLTLRGSDEVAVSPLSSTTDVRVSGGWGDPKFIGAFLPDAREVNTGDFSAEWTVLEVNRPLARSGLLSGSGGGQGAYVKSAGEAYKNDRLSRASAMSAGYYDDYGNYVEPALASGGADFDAYDFGVDLLLPVDDYRKAFRSARYALLFIAASFLTFFFIEVLNGRRLHLVQYLLIGAAIVLFYVLLLSLSEHVGFDWAYLLSAGAILALIGGYSWAVLDNRRLTGLVVGILALLYTYFYGLLQLQDYSLLIGSLGLLLALATIMYLTRHTNWQRLPTREPSGIPPLP